MGYTFEVDPKTVGGKFKLEVSRGAGVDIVFMHELGSRGLDYPLPGFVPPPSWAFDTPGPGGERGKIPDDFPFATVCLSDGSDASFMYTASKGVKKRRGKEGSPHLEKPADRLPCGSFLGRFCGARGGSQRVSSRRWASCA